MAGDRHPCQANLHLHQAVPHRYNCRALLADLQLMQANGGPSQPSLQSCTALAAHPLPPELHPCCGVQTSVASLITSFQPALAMAPDYDQGLEQLQRRQQALQSPPGVFLRTQALHLLSTVLAGGETHT